MWHRHVQLLRAEPRILAFGALCALLSSPGQTFFIALFVGSFAAASGLNAGQLGALYLAATLGSASLLPVLGHWIDRIDLRLYAALVLAGLSVACVVATQVTGPASLLVAFLLLRLFGQGLMTHLEVTSVARYFASRRGLALSLTGMGFPLAIGFMPLIAVAAIEALGWRLSYAVTGALLAGVALPFLLWLIRDKADFARPPARARGMAPPRVLDGLRIVARTRYFWLALPILLYLPFTSTALTFHIEALGLARGWPREMVAAAFSAFAIGHVAGLVLAGFVVDRLTARVMLPLMNVPIFLGIAAIGLSGHPLALFGFMASLGAASGLTQTTGGAVWAEVYGVARLGTIRSFATMLMVAGTAAGPAVLGLGLDAGMSVGAIATAFLLLGGAATVLAALGVSVAVPREAEDAA